MDRSPAIRKKETVPLAATKMDLELIILREISQTKTNLIGYHLHVESKKQYKWTYKRENSLTGDTENRPTVAKGGRLWGGVNQEAGVYIHTLLHVKQITNEDLQGNTGALLNRLQWPISENGPDAYMRDDEAAGTVQRPKYGA